MQIRIGDNSTAALKAFLRTVRNLSRQEKRSRVDVAHATMQLAARFGFYRGR